MELRGIPRLVAGSARARAATSDEPALPGHTAPIFRPRTSRASASSTWPTPASTAQRNGRVHRQEPEQLSPPRAHPSRCCPMPGSSMRAAMRWRAASATSSSSSRRAAIHLQHRAHRALLPILCRADGALEHGACPEGSCASSTRTSWTVLEATCGGSWISAASTSSRHACDFHKNRRAA